MKAYHKIIVPVLALLPFFSISAAESIQPDTVMVVNNPSQITITESPTGISLKVNGTDDDPEFTTSYSNDYKPNAKVTIRQRFTAAPFITTPNNTEIDTDYSNHALNLLSGLHAGFCTDINGPEGMPVEMGKSYEIGIDQVLSYSYIFNKERSFISIGVGVNWRNYRMTGNTRFIVDEESGNIVTGAYPEGTESKFSRLKQFSLTVPLYWTQKIPVRMIGKSTLAIRVGAILNWNAHASVLTSWEEADDTSVKQSSKYINHRPFTVDFLAAVRIAPSVGLYVKYSPMKFFKQDKGPEFSTLSTGIYLGF